MTDIRTLALAAGVEDGFHDIFGNHYPLVEATAAAIVRALGYPADSEAERRASLAAIEERTWRRGVPGTVIVAWESQPGHVELCLPEGTSTVSYILRREDGGTLTGVFPLDGVDPVERRTVDGQKLARFRVALPPGLPQGYHDLDLDLGDTARRTRVVVAPPECWQPEDAAPGRRLWGIAVQLYSLRGRASRPIGQFGDLDRVVERAAAEGANLIGLIPLHALYPADPENKSPYSPAHRDFLNVLYIDLERVPEVTANPAARAILDAASEASELVDYRAATERQMAALSAAFSGFGADRERRRRFEVFRAAGGEALERFARFQAIHRHLVATEGIFDWRQWPEGLRDPAGRGVADWAAAHADAVTFQAWLQWLADEQLGGVARLAGAKGMAVGLYRDLAVGVSQSSAAAWAAPDRLVQGVTVGAPPDLLNRRGQNWGLVPFNPMRLWDDGFSIWVEALRANMRHAGALRIDHAMAMMHGYWVPEGLSAAEGAYVSFPFEAMRRILALESRRNQCIVIGEDLGTVPEGFREAMASSGILSYRLLMFERVEGGLFARATTYPEAAMVAFTTHDLPTLRGYWEGVDLEVRAAHDIYPDAATMEADRADKAADRRRLVDALIDAGLWPAEPPVDTEALPFSPELAEAVHRFLARAPSRLMMVQIEDLIGERYFINLPGTVDEHPNWRRRLSKPVEAVFDDPLARRIVAAVAEERR